MSVHVVVVIFIQFSIGSGAKLCFASVFYFVFGTSEDSFCFNTNDSTLSAAFKLADNITLFIS